ncbi:MAG: hypothetical protein AAGA77_06700 [Bacteroidota bacterium]
MKGISLILAFLIFLTSLKASSFVAGFAYAMGVAYSFSSCCKKADDSNLKQCSDTPDNQEKKGCCEGNDCDCTCCLHIAYIQQLSDHSISSSYFSEVKFNYSFLYRADYLNSVFHPPAYL